MWYVYIVTSKKKDNWIYIGSTNDLRRRFNEHVLGLSLSTKPYRPLVLSAYIAVSTEHKARQLEKYLKVGSGKAILKKRILSDEAPSGA